MATHRMTIQYDARLSFNLNLPPDDAAIVRDQTLLTVIVEPSHNDETCASYDLKLRAGTGPDAQDFLQAEFVHRSAAEGAGTCLLQYLMGKKNLNVHPTVETDRHRHYPPDRKTFTAVGWSMSKHEPHAPPVVGPKQMLQMSE